MHFSHFFIAALTTISGRPEPSTGVVVATGLILVFAVLVILYLLITVQGKIFTAIDNKKNGGGSAPKTLKAPVILKTEIKATVPIEAPASYHIESGIPSEVVAAIAAAIACIDGGKYTVKSVRKVARTGRSAWGQAGVISYTEPF